jgi:hypothetical protein
MNSQERITANYLNIDKTLLEKLDEFQKKTEDFANLFDQRNTKIPENLVMEFGVTDVNNR